MVHPLLESAAHPGCKLRATVKSRPTCVLCRCEFCRPLRRKGDPVIYEICVDSVAGVRAAEAAGADRVELCGDLLEGGTTPSRGMIHEARRIAGIGLNVMIRPRGGDFLFDDDEFAIMKADIDTAKMEGADGVVIGLLSADGMVNAKRTRELIALARPLSVTFHRAFDM